MTEQYPPADDQHVPDCDDYAFSGAGFHPTCERSCICRQVARVEHRVLNAAREAVGAALSHEGHCKVLGIRKNCKCSRFDALAVIDALRKDSND